MSLTSPMPPKEAQKVISKQLADVKRPAPALLGETLIRMGRLQREQITQVVEAQQKTGGAFGRTAVKLGLIEQQDLQYALGVQLGFLYETQNPVAIPAPLVVAQNPYSQYAEEFRQMRTRLLTGASVEKLKLFSVTGVDAEVGADYAAVNLAASFAQLGRRVLLVDADLRRPSLAKVFGDPGAPGVVEIAGGHLTYKQALSETLVKNLDLLPAGAPAYDSQSVFVSDAFAKILECAKSEYDTVMLLTAPFGEIADCELVWSATKHTLVIARQDKSRAEALSKMKSVLRGVGAEIIGAAMTR
jgi:protein-tyrosine kinase